MKHATGNQKETHLCVDEILDFVTLSEYNDAAVTLCASVNCHIRSCAVCRRRVRSFQDVHDAFLKLHSPGNFRAFAAQAYGAESLELEEDMERE